MGGQACVFYGAAEFSRDADLALLAESANLLRLKKALRELRADVIAVPPFDIKYLRKGHAIHFRCMHPDVKGIRIDVMSVMRGVAPFRQLWKRRTSITIGAESYELMALEDLVLAKKTQRDRDWPMIRRLLEAHYAENRGNPSNMQVRFWLNEMRTSGLLAEIAGRFPELTKQTESERQLLTYAQERTIVQLNQALLDEAQREQETDRQYWLPLKKELEQLRLAKTGSRARRRTKTER